VKGVALVPRSGDGLGQKAVVESGIVCDQDCPLAATLFHRPAHGHEAVLQRLPLWQGATQRAEGVDAVELDCLGFDDGILERLDMAGDGLGRFEPPVVIDGDGDHGDLEQRICLAVETAGLDIHDYREVTAKPLCHAGVIIGHGAAG